MTVTEFLAVRRAQAITVSRPRGVLHAYVGPRTPSGWFVPRSRRTVCRAHTRRLAAVAPSAASTMCARCSARLTSPGGRAEHSPVSRAEHLAAYGHLTIRDLFYAAGLTATAAETYTVSYLARLRFGAEPVRIHAGSTVLERQLFDLNARILKARRHWEAVELDDTERAARQAKREAEAFNDDLVKTARRKDAARDRALDRARAGSYLTPYERSLVS